MCRYILTKAVGRFDNEGDDDCHDITEMYRNSEITDNERFAIFNSVRGVCKYTPAVDYQVRIKIISYIFLTLNYIVKNKIIFKINQLNQTSYELLCRIPCCQYSFKLYRTV